jgi:hypothetical protein
MAKGQQKGNREAKKPKATKKPAPAATSSFLHPSSATAGKGAKK